MEGTSSFYKEFLFQLWGKGKPLCALFSTSNKSYLYDSGTNKIFKCENIEYDLLDCLLTSTDFQCGFDKFISLHSKEQADTAISTLAESINKNNILKLAHIQSFSLSHDPSFVIDKVYNELGMLLLEVTQECNLRCKYCIYDENFSEKRNHCSIHMTRDIAIKSIDHLRHCSKRCNDVSIGFYGGEPLLRFNLIKEIVSYAKKTLSEKKLNFSITTNGTLINDVIANFLFREDFGVLVSLDGPEEIHDLWRTDKSNKGSFERTFAGLKRLALRYGDKFKKIGLSIVYAPPYSEQKINKIYEFISSFEWLPKDMKIVITYPHEGSLSRLYNCNGEIKGNRAYDFSLSNWARNKFFDDYEKGIPHDPLSSSIMEIKLARLVQRPVLDYPVDASHLNGCCIPGSRKLFITAKGEMKLCERIGISPDIGNVFEGINPEIIKDKYIIEYSNQSIKDCSHCWLIRLCPICYQQAFYNNKIDMQIKELYCELHRRGTIKDLSDYCSLIEIYEHGLDYLLEWKIS